MSPCSASTRCHPSAGEPDGARPAPATTTASTGPATSPRVRSASAAAAKPSTGSIRWHRTDRDSSARVSDPARSGRSETTAHERTDAGAGSGPAGSSKIGPKRGLPPPVLACRDSASASAPGTTTSSTRAREVTGSVRTTSRRRGASTTATSGPPTKSTWPEHQPKPPSTRWAPIGPRSSGSATERKEIPPPPDRPAFRARSRAEAIIRVAAMGDMAFTVTPGGAWRPSCHVRAATARLAQLYAPASAWRQPEPEVTPRMRPYPAAAMSGSAASRTFR